MGKITRIILLASFALSTVGCSLLPSQKQVPEQDNTAQIEQLKKEKAAADSQIASLKAQLQDSPASSNTLLPPNAKAGHCYARALIPAQYRTEYVTVETKAESEILTAVATTYKTVTERILVKEASEKIVVVSPAQYKTVDEQVLVRPAYQIWKKGRGPIEKIDETTGEIVCLVDVAAQYKTVSKQILLSPPIVTKTVIPAEYKAVSRQVIDSPAHTASTKIPSEHSKVAKRVQVADAVLEWREILCETNTTPDIVRRIQTALQSKGFNPGPIDGVIGRRTTAAIAAFQKSKNLSTGQLTVATVEALGVL